MAHLGKISYVPGIDRVCGYWTWTWKLLIGDLKGSTEVHLLWPSKSTKKKKPLRIHYISTSSFQRPRDPSKE